MEIKIFDDRKSMAAAASLQAANAICLAIAERGKARIVAATAASQQEFLKSLKHAAGIDWSRVEAFHLDEYIALPMSHPGSFRKMFLEQFIEPTGISTYHLLHGDGDIADVVQQAGQAIRSAPIDVAFIGIGENGHLAFNDPPADFETADPYIVVQLDAACRRQQVGEGWFRDLSEVPQRAISMSVRQILAAQELIVIVPGSNKVEAVERCFGGPVTPMAPGSILRTHPNATVYLDRDSAARIGERLSDKTIHVTRVHSEPQGSL